jgi:hypothetical protein
MDPFADFVLVFGFSIKKRFRVDIGNFVRQVEQTGVGVQKTNNHEVTIKSSICLILLLGFQDMLSEREKARGLTRKAY